MEASFEYPSAQATWAELNPRPFVNNGELEDDQTVINALYAALEGEENA